MNDTNFENYEKEMLTIDLVKANVKALYYLIFFAVIFAVPYLLIWGFNSKPLFETGNKIIDYAFPFLLFVTGIILHELVHGIFFARYAKNGFRSVKFGIMWKALAPYAHCKEPLKIKQYTIALLTPLIFVGIIPAIIGLLTGSALLTIFGIILSGGAAGDLMIYDLIKKENPEDYVQDHPSEAGCWIYRKDALNH